MATIWYKPPCLAMPDLKGSIPRGSAYDATSNPPPAMGDSGPEASVCSAAWLASSLQHLLQPGSSRRQLIRILRRQPLKLLTALLQTLLQRLFCWYLKTILTTMPQLPQRHCLLRQQASKCHPTSQPTAS